MDWGAWSPSHTILVLFIVAGFIGQGAIYFHRTAQNPKRIERSEERAEKRDAELLAMIDKRITEVNQRIGENSQRIDSLRSEINQRFSEMNAEIADVRSEMRQLNQNHIEHLSRHHSP